MRYLFLLTLFFWMVASGCKKTRRSDFPNVRFEEYIYLNNPSNYALTTPGGWVYHNGGYRGLIVVRRFINGTQDDFAAFDQACPEHYAQDCSVLEVEPDNTYAKCPCHGEKYLLFDGSPVKGASQSLIQYRSDYSGSVVYIYN